MPLVLGRSRRISEFKASMIYIEKPGLEKQRDCFKHTVEGAQGLTLEAVFGSPHVITYTHICTCPYPKTCTRIHIYTLEEFITWAVVALPLILAVGKQRQVDL